MIRLAGIFVSVMLVAFPGVCQEPDRWEKTIQRFEREDASNPPEPGGILFVGSSSIRFWDTDAAFPEHDVINRGFGGSQTSDVLQYFDRIVLPYAPRLIVFYEGDNDIAAGKTPETVIADTEQFIDQVREELPKAGIVYVAIKPSLARWNMVSKMREVNAAVQALAAQDPLLDYLDVDTPMLGEDGKPRPELFVSDGLHLNADGYALWNELIRPHLEAAEATE